MRAIWNSTLATTAFALLAAALAVALGMTPAAPVSLAQMQITSKDAIAKEKSAELQALKHRATNLAKEMEGHLPANPAVKGDLQLAWVKLLSDFDQWAAKFHIPTQEMMLPTYVGGPNGPVPKNYPLLTEGPPGVAGSFCMKDFARSTDAQFAYRCYKE